MVVPYDVIEKAIVLARTSSEDSFHGDEWMAVNEKYDLNLWEDDTYFYGTLYEVDEKGSIVTDDYLRVYIMKKGER